MGVGLCFEGRSGRVSGGWSVTFRRGGFASFSVFGIDVSLCFATYLW